MGACSHTRLLWHLFLQQQVRQLRQQPSGISPGKVQRELGLHTDHQRVQNDVLVIADVCAKLPASYRHGGGAAAGFFHLWPQLGHETGQVRQLPRGLWALQGLQNCWLALEYVGTGLQRKVLNRGCMHRALQPCLPAVRRPSLREQAYRQGSSNALPGVGAISILLRQLKRVHAARQRLCKGKWCW
jgi:hypothetical protein